MTAQSKFQISQIYSRVYLHFKFKTPQKHLSCIHCHYRPQGTPKTCKVLYHLFHLIKKAPYSPIPQYRHHQCSPPHHPHQKHHQWCAKLVKELLIIHPLLKTWKKKKKVSLQLSVKQQSGSSQFFDEINFICIVFVGMVLWVIKILQLCVIKCSTHLHFIMDVGLWLFLVISYLGLQVPFAKKSPFGNF